MPSIASRISDVESKVRKLELKAPLSEISAFNQPVPAAPTTSVDSTNLGPVGAPVPRIGLPPNSVLPDSTIHDANPDSPYFQRKRISPLMIEAGGPFSTEDEPAFIPEPTPDIPSPAPTGASLPVASIVATESPYKSTPSGVYSLVSVSFSRVLSDTTYGHTNIWVNGYHGSTEPVLVASAVDSPASFLLETTGETVTITAVTVAITGASNLLAGSPFTTVDLDGVVSAPPAPSIVQSLVGTPVGYQFIFAQETGLLADIISNYNVYRNSSNTTVGATIIQQIPQNSTNTGEFVVQDTLNDAQVYYYWVSAVNTSGLESSLTAAQSGAVSGSWGSVPPVWSTNFGYDSPIPGTSMTIYWDGTHSSSTITIYRADGTTTGPISGSQTITGLTASTTYYFYPYYDEASATLTFVDGGTGTPDYAFTAASATESQTQGLRGHIPLSIIPLTTATGSGGGGSSGGGSGFGCVIEGSTIEPLSGMCLAHLKTADDWVFIATENGFSVTGVPNHPVISSSRGKIKLEDLLIGERIVTKRGLSSVSERNFFSAPANKIVISVPEGELYWANGILSSNVKSRLE